MQGNNTHFTILVPGADSLPFGKDQKQAEVQNITVRELNLPSFAGHPIDDQRAHFDAVADLILATCEDIKSEVPTARIAAIGRNNGGGLLSWALARGFQPNAIVLVGAIPEISRYRKDSQAQSAIKFRQTIKDQKDLNRIDEMLPLDITSSSKDWPDLNCLFQFGSDDPFIDETSANAIQTFAKQYRVEWLKDDHKMESESALTQRWNFIKKLLY